MNNRKIMSSVFEKISNGKEVNLESQKVELNEIELAMELKDYGKKAQSIYLDARNLAQKDLMDLRDKFEDGERKLNKLSGELNGEISRIGKQAKSIGIDIKETSVYKNMNKAVQEVMEYQTSFGKAINKTKGFKL